MQEKTVTFPVVLSDGNTYRVAGHYYDSPGFGRRTLQVLVHGATYDHRYWDAPKIHGRSYSYARHMVEEGYDVLALDQLGTGDSDQPDGMFFTVEEAAESLHQVMASLRTVHNPIHERFQTIVLVGHSLGSITAVASEAIYGDADGLVLTGMALTPHPAPVGPEVLGGLLQSPYVSFPASLRSNLFYHPTVADPAMVTYDNSHMATEVPLSHFVSGLQLSSDPVLLGSDLITEPVFIQLGQYDVTAPGSLAANEASYYPSAESVTVKSLPYVGHAFNLHETHELGWSQIEKWIDDKVDDGNCWWH
ncbi:Hypothetical protein A7982_00173 [Minicystis rosea]|nr:Hypothetical protein A7982_00173 [Minicystis rosea]